MVELVCSTLQKRGGFHLWWLLRTRLTDVYLEPGHPGGVIVQPDGTQPACSDVHLDLQELWSRGLTGGQGCLSRREEAGWQGRFLRPDTAPATREPSHESQQQEGVRVLHCETSLRASGKPVTAYQRAQGALMRETLYP